MITPQTQTPKHSQRTEAEPLILSFVLNLTPGVALWSTPVQRTVRRTVSPQLPRAICRRAPEGSFSLCQSWMALQDKTQAFFFTTFIPSFSPVAMHKTSFCPLLFSFSRGRGALVLITWLEFTWDGKKSTKTEGKSSNKGGHRIIIVRAFFIRVNIHC